MRISYRSLLSSLLVIFIYGLPAAAQTSSPAGAAAPPDPGDGETIADYRDKLVRFYLQPPGTAETTNEVAEAVAAKTTAAAAPEGLAQRVNEAISDFLPIFQFAVQGVSTSEDSESVTLKLNPLKFAHGVISIAGTATEPGVFSELVKAIAQPVQEAQSKALLEEVDDLSDVTATLEYGFQLQPGNWSTSRKLFGRDARIYQSLIGELLHAAWASTPEEAKEVERKAEQALDPFLPRLRVIDSLDPLSVTFGKLESAFRTDLVAVLKEATQKEAALRTAFREAGGEALEDLPALIDNQPQLVFKVSRRFSDEVVGPESKAISVSYEMGSKNFNSVLREYHRLENTGGGDTNQDATLKLQALKLVTEDERFGNEDKLIFNFTYKDVDEYSFLHEYRIESVDPPDGPLRQAVVNLDRSRELRGKLLWTRFIRFPKREESEEERERVAALPNPNDPDFLDKAIPAEQKPRLTLSIESVDFKDDPTRHDQVIGKVTYVAPLSGGMALPVTLVWANRPEFVGQVDHQFSAHVGISYKLGREGKENEEK